MTVVYCIVAVTAAAVIIIASSKIVESEPEENTDKEI